MAVLQREYIYNDVVNGGGGVPQGFLTVRRGVAGWERAAGVS